MTVTANIVNENNVALQDLIGQRDRFYAGIGIKKEEYFVADAESNVELVWVLVEKDGEAIGMGGLAFHGDDVEVKSIYITNAARGTGASKIIMSKLESIAKGRGIDELVLETTSMMPAAIGLYTKIGYTISEPFGGRRHNGANLFMKKAI